MRNTLTYTFLFISILSFGATGGPDAYGYTWIDSNEPGGPVYNWVDITGVGVLVTGLADDNVVGPYGTSIDIPYYWYEEKLVWIGSNGYVAFGDHNIAAAFPNIPTAGGGDNYVAPFMSDLDHTTNPNSEVYYYDNADSTVISFIDIPFWNQPTSSNTFQVIFTKADSCILFQYMTQVGTTLNDDIKIGIEDVTGTIGLQHSSFTYPSTNYAIKFINPSSPLMMITDMEASWNNITGSKGIFSVLPASFNVRATYDNVGQVPISNIGTYVEVTNAAGTVQYMEDSMYIANLLNGVDTLIVYPTPFVPSAAQTYAYNSLVYGVSGEISSMNNTQQQEIVVVDSAVTPVILDYHGNIDDGIGISWNGGNGGIAYYFEPPYYPVRIEEIYYRIAQNPNVVGFYAKVYDDDGILGAPGTLLDSVYVPPASVILGTTTIVTPSVNLDVLSGGVYVLWDMGGDGIALARDVNPPFSKQVYEVIAGGWAEYRDRETEDFFIGIHVGDTATVTPPPPLTVDDEEWREEFELYPNPTESVLQVLYDSGRIYPAWVLDGVGRTVMELVLDQPATTFDMSGLEPGRYLFVVETNSGLVVNTFVVR